MTDASSGRCARCGGPLSPNSCAPGGSVVAASPPGELCEPCLTGHKQGWYVTEIENWWLIRLCRRIPIVGRRIPPAGVYDVIPGSGRKIHSQD